MVGPAERGQWCGRCGRDCRRLKGGGFRKEGLGLMGEKDIVGSTIFRGLEGWRRGFRDRGVMVCSCGEEP